MEINGQYLSFEEYKSLGGTLNESAFILLEYKARKKIDEETLGRIKGLTIQKEEVKLCLFDLINKLESYSKSDSDIKSESVDGYNITYNTKTIKEQDDEMSGVIFTYLINCRLDNGIPYLYRGF